MSNNNNPGNNTNSSKNKIEPIKVYIRLRPLLQHEDIEFWKIDEHNNNIYTVNTLSQYGRLDQSRDFNSYNPKERDHKKILMDSIYSPQSFYFDKIYNINCNSQQIYKENCRHITKSVINGYNGTIFLYGQTTSGKTFTMLGTPNSPGLLPCSIRDIFNLISKEKYPERFSVYCSYIEIYNENIHDLLTDANNLKLVDDSKYGVIVNGAKKIKIKNFEDGITLKDFGEENRKYRETLINEYSSRSHSIFQIFVENQYYDEVNNVEGMRYSFLNLVDLAGSERLNDYDNKTEANGETGYINKSLFVLANVVNKLAEGKSNYIPYRDSKLTRLLSQALGGNSLTNIICTASPAAVNYYQTLSTLRFATRAKVVKTKPIVNQVLDDKNAIEFYKMEIKRLQEELKNGKNKNSNDEKQKLILSDKEKSEIFKNEFEKLKNSGGKKLFEDYFNNINNEKDYNSNNENSYMENLLTKINSSVNNEGSNLNANKLRTQAEFIENSHKITSEYKNELQGLQNRYKDRLKELSYKHFPRNAMEISRVFGSDVNGNLNNQMIEENSISPKSKGENLNLNNNNNYFKTSYANNTNPNDNNMYSSNKNNISNLINTNNHFNTNNNNSNFNSGNDFFPSDESDEVIKKIKNGAIFRDIRFIFNSNIYDNFENNIKLLKQNYEDRIDTLERNMEYYKSYLENHYRKKIQKTKSNFMDNIELISDNLPIMNITSEHNDKLRILRELYDEKLKELEHIFFDNLKSITSSRMSHNNENH